MEQLKEVEDKETPARDLGNTGILSKDAEKDNSENENCDQKPEIHSVVEVKSEFPVIDLAESKSGHEETEGKTNNAENETNSAPVKNTANSKFKLEKICGKEFWLTEAPRNGTSEKPGEEGQKIYKLTEIGSSSVEHNYCQMGKLGFLPRKIKIQKSTCLKLQSGGTFKFQNGAPLGKKIMEQPTVGVKNSVTTNHVDQDSDLSKNNSVKVGLKRKVVSLNNVNPRCVSDDNLNKKVLGFLTPKIRIRKSKGNGDYYDVMVEDGASMPPLFLAAKPDSSEVKKSDKKLECQNADAKAEQKPESRKRVIGSDDIVGQVTEMEKIGESRSDAFPNSAGKHAENTDLKSNDVPPAKIRKLSSKEDAPPSQNGAGFVLSKPNSTKTVPEDKNWNLEYTEDDAKNLGLDDLLLKASELNAENFTKALGQSSGGRNGNKIDSPDIVLGFPAGKRESDEPLDGDNPKGGNAKKAKLEILKKCVLDDNFMKSIEEESLKKTPELPKKPGIKVKTVQNINEEFKDSLGAKMKMMEGRDVAPESSIPVFTINDDVQECNQTKEVLIQGRVLEKQPPPLSCIKVNSQQSPTKNIDGLSGETRPYVMTIMPNKGNHAKNQMTATLTPKVFIKPKSVLQNRATFLPAAQGRPGDAANNKIPGGQDSLLKSNDNVTFVVPQPRSFEVVNVDGYPDPGTKKMGLNSHFVVNYGPLTKKDSDGKNITHATPDTGATMKNIPILVSRNKKFVRMPLVNGQKVLITPADDKRINNGPNMQNGLVNTFPGGNANFPRENNLKAIPSFTISSIEPRVIMKEPVSGIAGGNCIRVIQKVASPPNVQVIKTIPQIEAVSKNLEVQIDNLQHEGPEVMTLPAFANILKDILPDKWILYLDKKFGLQILRTHLDDYMNPSIMMSVVVGTTGKVTVNVRGRQLEHSHELFANMCDVGNSQEKISLNYILAIMNRLRYYGICFGCDDLSLKKYWCEDGFIEYYTEFQQTYRSHICESLIRMGRKRCHPCYRMHESLKKRKRREIIARKAGKLPKPKPVENIVNVTYSMTHNSQEKGLKRTLEDYMDESFFLMKRSIKDEIQRIKEKEESEKIPKTQDEVLGSMGLARKQSLDVNVRKSKREKKGFRRFDPLAKTSVNKEELFFLEKYWREINILYTTSLLVGGYSRLSTAILKDKCKKFYRLLSIWRKIVRNNAICIGGHFNLAENLVIDGETVNSEVVKNKFDSMDDAALRSYVMSCVKELNRMKNRLRTKNKCFMALYNSYMKPNLRKAKQTDAPSSSGANKNSAAQKNVPKKKKASEKPKKTKAATSTEAGSSD